MKVWTVANQKGGVGKTTTVISLAGLLSQSNERVLLVDTDPHGSLTSYLGFSVDKSKNSLYDLFREEEISKDKVKNVINNTGFKNLDLITANMALATLDKVLGSKSGMGLILYNILQAVKDDYDYVIIDCPPVLGVMMVNALAASERVLVPVQTEFLAIKGLERMVKTFQIMQKACPSKLRYTVIPTMFDKRTRAALSSLNELKLKYKEHIWNSVIPVDTKFRDASLKRQPPSYFNDQCRGVFAYKTLLQYLKRLSLDSGVI